MFAASFDDGEVGLFGCREIGDWIVSLSLGVCQSEEVESLIDHLEGDGLERDTQLLSHVIGEINEY